MSDESAQPQLALETHVERAWPPSISPEQWNALVSASAAPSIFQTFEWLDAWWQAFGEGREVLVLRFAEAGRLCGVAAMYKNPAHFFGAPTVSLYLVGDGSYDGEHLAALALPGNEARVAAAFEDWLKTHPGEWDVLHLEPMTGDAPMALALKKQFSDRLWFLKVRSTPGLAMNLAGGWPLVQKRLSREMRRDLRYQSNALHRLGDVSVMRCEREEAIGPALAKLYDLHARRWNRKSNIPGTFADGRRRQLYERFAPIALERGWLELNQLQVGGQTVAVEYGYLFAGRYSAVQTGFDPDHPQFGPINCLRAELMKRLSEAGADSYDFLPGGETYKRRWSPDEYSVAHLTVARSGSWGSLVMRAGAGVGQFKRILEGNTPSWLWRAIRRAYSVVKPRSRQVYDGGKSER